MTEEYPDEYLAATALVKAQSGLRSCVHPNCATQAAANKLLQAVIAEVARLRQENARLRAELQMAEFLANAAR